MKRIPKCAIFALAILSGLVPAAYSRAKSDTVYACSLEKGTTIKCATGKACEASASGKEDTTLKLAGPESDEPVLLGNVGNTVLHKISKAPEHVSIELTPLGGVIIYTWFPETSRLFQSKTYNVFGLAEANFTSLYQCKKIAD